MTAEKTSPSPITIVADVHEAVKIQKRMSSGRMALKDALAKTVAEYNKLCSNKKHKIDAGRRSLIWNLQLGMNSTGSNR